MLGERTRPRRRPLRHPCAPRRRAARCAVRRGARACPRCAHRRRRHPQPAGLLGLRRHRPRPRRQTGCRVPTTVVDAGRDGRRAHGDGRHRRRRPLRSVHLHRHLGYRGHVVGRLDVAAPHRCRDASDQQRRRRQQLRDAGAEPAQPCLRPRHARRRRIPYSPGWRRRTPHHPRRRRPNVHLRRPVHLRRERRSDRCGRDHGWARHRDQRQHHDGGARDGVVLARRDRPDRHADQPSLGGVSTIRAWCRPLRHAVGDRPVRRVAVGDVPEPGRARRRCRCPQ